MQIRGFYAVVNLEPGPDVAGRAARLAERLLAGGASIVQVRMKGSPAAQLLAAALAVRELTRAAGVPLVVNDRVDVALAAGAEAVHLGQDDLPIAAARQVVAAAGGRLAIGVSTHDLAQARAAAAAGADYLGFGPVFATETKANPDRVVGLSALAQVVAAVAPLSVVAIGGITLERVAEIARAGAAAACVISAVNSAADVAAGGRAVVAAFGA